VLTGADRAGQGSASVPIAGAGCSIGRHVKARPECQRNGAPLIGAQALDAHGAVARVDQLLQVAIAITVAYLEDPERRRDRLKERRARRGAAAVICGPYFRCSMVDTAIE